MQSRRAPTGAAAFYFPAMPRKPDIPDELRAEFDAWQAASDEDSARAENSMPRQVPTSLLERVQEVLFQEWDPIGVKNNEQCRDEYDSYAPGLCRLLREGADEYRLAAHLGQLMRVSMGLSLIDEQHNREIARRLIDLAKQVN